MVSVAPARRRIRRAPPPVHYVAHTRGIQSFEERGWRRWRLLGWLTGRGPKQYFKRAGCAYRQMIAAGKLGASSLGVDRPPFRFEALTYGTLDRLKKALLKHPEEIPGAIACIRDRVIYLLKDCEDQPALRRRLVDAVVAQEDVRHSDLFQLKLVLSRDEQRALLARTSSPVTRGRLRLVGFDDSSGHQDGRYFSGQGRPVAEGRYGSPSLESFVDEHQLAPRLSEVLDGRPGQLANETPWLPAKLGALDSQALEALRRFIDRNHSPAGRAKLIYPCPL